MNLAKSDGFCRDCSEKLGSNLQLFFFFLLERNCKGKKTHVFGSACLGVIPSRGVSSVWESTWFYLTWAHYIGWGIDSGIIVLHEKWLWLSFFQCLPLFAEMFRGIGKTRKLLQICRRLVEFAIILPLIKYSWIDWNVWMPSWRVLFLVLEHSAYVCVSLWLSQLWTSAAL